MKPGEGWGIARACGIGFVADAAYHLVVLAWEREFGISDAATQALFAPGIAIAPRSFEGAFLVLVYNVVSFFFIFSGLAWCYLFFRERRVNG